MFEVDEMEGCHSCLYEEFDIEKEPCKHCYGFSSYTKKKNTDYESRLKADMVAMLTEIQLEIEEQKRDELSYQQTWNYPLNVCVSIIQQKIDKLKGES